MSSLNTQLDPGVEVTTPLFNGHNDRNSSQRCFQAERTGIDSCACSVLVSGPDNATRKVSQVLILCSANRYY